MPSSGRHILDIKKKGPSRAKARGQMGQLFTARPKPQRLKTQRQKKRLILACVCALSALGLVGGLGAVSHMEQLAIKDVSVTGAQALPPEALVAAAAGTMQNDGWSLFSRENMFLFSRAAMERALMGTYPRIKDVSIARPSLLAQVVVVTVEERVPYARWCAESVISWIPPAIFLPR